MADPRVLVYTPMGDVDAQYSELEDAGCEVTFGDTSWRRAFGAEESNVFPLAEGRDAIIGAVMRGFSFTHDFMAKLPDARIIAKLTIGYDDVDIDAAACDQITRLVHFDSAPVLDKIADSEYEPRRPVRSNELAVSATRLPAA